MAPPDRGFDAVCAAFRAHGHFLRPTPKGVRTTCPVHHDRRPSLTISRADDPLAAVIFCHACKKPATEAILRAVGLTTFHLYASDRPPWDQPAREVLAEYPYVTIQGDLVATKVRYRRAFDNKRFAWRVDDRWALPPEARATLPLYREVELIDSKQVFVVEGEKAADRLWADGLPATCAPHGAGHWEARWTNTLTTLGPSEVVVLTDADQPGQAHGELVAAALHAAGLVVRVVALPGLPRGGDVVDYLQAHSAGSLDAEVAASPPWWPGQAESERVEKERATWRRQKAAQRARKGGVDPDISGALSTLRNSAVSTLSTCPPRVIVSDLSSKNLTCTDMEVVRKVDIYQGQTQRPERDLERGDPSSSPLGKSSGLRDLASRNFAERVCVAEEMPLNAATTENSCDDLPRRHFAPDRSDPDWEIYCPMCGLEACERLDHMPP